MISILLIHSDAAPGGRLYKKGQRGANVRWSNDEYLISIGRPPNPPGYKLKITSTTSINGIKNKGKSSSKYRMYEKLDSYYSALPMFFIALFV